MIHVGHFRFLELFVYLNIVECDDRLSMSQTTVYEKYIKLLCIIDNTILQIIMHYHFIGFFKASCTHSTDVAVLY